MPNYAAPLRDMRFMLYEVADLSRLHAVPAYADMQPDLIDPVLEGAATLCQDILLPINRSGDEAGCVLENGVVRTPAGFPEAYAAFREGGWAALSCDPEWGGQGLPNTIAILANEMICSANLSFGMYPGLSHGVYSALVLHGSEEQKRTYLPKLTSGEWTGTMCLTEPQCGTDLGMIRTRAEPDDLGSYRINGTKIFISAGEHDLAGNIVHLVLAKLPDAPAGTRGISLFVVPKFLPTEDGRPGSRNGVSCGSIEHKMGIKASSTCVMNFDDARGWLVGKSHRGMPAMFTMMNEARLLVGIQGLGLAEVSYQNAVAYARERRQGRALNATKSPGPEADGISHKDADGISHKDADAIIVHPDVRRMLLTMRASIEGCRALGVECALQHDISIHHPDPAIRQEAEDYVALMTPVIKAFFTDMGWEMTATGMQVLGGHGYIREWGMEQFVRDARIAQIYEGTNGIQALDLVGRKMPLHAGRLLRRFFHPALAYIETNQADPAMGEFILPLAKAFGRLQKCTAELARRGMADPFEAGAGATDYLKLFGLTAVALAWVRMAQVALPKAELDPFYQAKLTTARFYMQKLLPQTAALSAAILAGGGTLKQFDDAMF